jgi:hypothetical protein
VSLIPAFLVAARRGEWELIRASLKNLTKWIADRYETTALGLAAGDAQPREEVDYLLGDPFEHVALTRRQESYLATVVLDLASILNLSESFEVARNEFLAVGLYPTILESPDTADQYTAHADAISFTPNVEYADSWCPEDGWKLAPHHRRARSDYYLQRYGRHWDHLALCSVLRDRHYLQTCRHFLP